MNKLKYLAFSLYFVFSFFFSFLPAYAEEKFRDYQVHIKIEEDASLLVREKILVNVEGDKILRGITRYFPTRAYSDEGLDIYTYEFLSIKEGVRLTSYVARYGFDIASLATGREDVILSPGLYEFQIIYRTKGHISYLEDYDEIYFNALTTQNIFPVEKARVSVELPNDSEPLFFEVFTGYEGEANSDYFWLNETSVQTSRPYQSGEGMTIAVGFEKGLVAFYENPLEVIFEYRDHMFIALILLMFIYLFCLYIFVYKSKNKSLTVIPIYEPTEPLSPSLAAYFHKKESSITMLYSTIVWSAVQGFLRMDLSDEKNIILEAKQAQEENFKEEDRWIYKACLFFASKIFQTKDTLALNDNDGVLVYEYNALAKEAKNYAKKVMAWPIFLAIALAQGLLLLMMHYTYHPGVFYEVGPIDIWIVQLMVYAYFAIPVMLSKKSKRKRTLIVCLLIFFPAQFLICIDDLSFMLYYDILLLTPVFFFMPFAHSLTGKGKELENQALGLEMYIKMAEEDRLKILNAPEMNLDTYEKILPYAIALDCADAWEESFKKSSIDIEKSIDRDGGKGAKDDVDWISFGRGHSRGVLFSSGASIALTKGLMSAEDAIKSNIAHFKREQKARERREASARQSSSSRSSRGGGFGGSSGRGSGGGGTGGW